MSRSDDMSVRDESCSTELSGSAGHGSDHGRQPGVLIGVCGASTNNAGLETFRVLATFWKKEQKIMKKIQPKVDGS